jgi:hypothetical protein
MKDRTRALSICFFATALVAGCNSLEDGAPAAASTSAEALVKGGSTTFIVTRLDMRRCIAPLCGGYFVKAVNLARTTCADGSSAADCHAFRLDFGPSGIDPARAAAFEHEAFAPGHALVRGRLEQRPAGPFPEDVLVVEQAWEGQAASTPRGRFEELTATGVVCVTFPCDSYRGKRLNVGTITSFNAVDLAASGAPADAVAAGNEALNAAGILAAGVHVPIVGPAGRGRDFSATEFYLRVPSSCRAQDARGVGPCDRFFGYAWDGQACVGISGCSCEGADCERLYQSLEACQAAHRACAPRRCGSRGLPPCGRDQYCDFPDGSQCGADDRGGVCRPRPQICPAIFDPVCGCDGQTYSSACVAAGKGVDAASDGECPAGPGGGACTTDADCRTFSDYCTGCDCRALSVNEKDPLCPGPGVQCLIDPCLGQTAACVAGRCALAGGASR